VSLRLADVVLLLMLPALAGCADASGATSFQSVCESAGLCDEAPAPPELVDILCDAGSSCTRESARATIEGAARFLATRSGSRLRVWMLDASVAGTRNVGELPTPTLSRRTRSRRAQLERFAVHARSVLTLSLEPAFARTGTHRAPIAESLAKIALADGYGLPRRIVVISDAREFSSIRDLACGRLPSSIDFARALHRRDIFTPGSLAHIEVTFAFAASAAVRAGRCAVSIGRERTIRTLWTSALGGAGASAVRFDSGVPVLVGERPVRAPSLSTNDQRSTSR
jgi:hypothetical protein